MAKTVFRIPENFGTIDVSGMTTIEAMEAQGVNCDSYLRVFGPGIERMLEEKRMEQGDGHETT